MKLKLILRASLIGTLIAIVLVGAVAFSVLAQFPLSVYHRELRWWEWTSWGHTWGTTETPIIWSSPMWGHGCGTDVPTYVQNKTQDPGKFIFVPFNFEINGRIYHGSAEYPRNLSQSITIELIRVKNKIPTGSKIKIKYARLRPGTAYGKVSSIKK